MIAAIVLNLMILSASVASENMTFQCVSAGGSSETFEITAKHEPNAEHGTVHFSEADQKSFRYPSISKFIETPDDQYYSHMFYFPNPYSRVTRDLRIYKKRFGFYEDGLLVVGDCRSCSDVRRILLDCKVTSN